jgi:hypothetical protein
VTNAVRHARADVVGIDVKAGRGQVRIRIAGDGIGLRHGEAARRSASLSIESPAAGASRPEPFADGLVSVIPQIRRPTLETTMCCRAAPTGSNDRHASVLLTASDPVRAIASELGEAFTTPVDAFRVR